MEEEKEESRKGRMEGTRGRGWRGRRGWGNRGREGWREGVRGWSEGVRGWRGEGQGGKEGKDLGRGGGRRGIVISSFLPTHLSSSREPASPWTSSSADNQSPGHCCWTQATLARSHLQKEPHGSGPGHLGKATAPQARWGRNHCMPTRSSPARKP